MGRGKRGSRGAQVGIPLSDGLDARVLPDSLREALAAQSRDANAGLFDLRRLPVASLMLCDLDYRPFGVAVCVGQDEVEVGSSEPGRLGGGVRSDDGLLLEDFFRNPVGNVIVDDPYGRSAKISDQRGLVGTVALRGKSCDVFDRDGRLQGQAEVTLGLLDVRVAAAGAYFLMLLPPIE